MDVCWVWIYGYVLRIELTGGVEWGLLNYFFHFSSRIFQYFGSFSSSDSCMNIFIQSYSSLFNFFFHFSIFMKFNIFYSVASVFNRCRKIIQCANIHESDFLDIMSKYERKNMNMRKLLFLIFSRIFCIHGFCGWMDVKKMVFCTMYESVDGENWCWKQKNWRMYEA